MTRDFLYNKEKSNKKKNQLDNADSCIVYNLYIYERV